MTSIPTEFDDSFLDWFRERTEAAWAALPARTPKDALAEYVKRGAGGEQWQAGTRWLNGLREEEIIRIERRWGLTFPPDYRLFLRRLHTVDRPMLSAGYLGEGERPSAAPERLTSAYLRRYRQYMVLEEGPSFYNWLTDTDALEGQFAWLWEGLQFDIEHNDLWLSAWGAKPAPLEVRNDRARALVEAAPKLIPIYGHRYLLAEPCAAGNPVFSVYQSDIVVYGANLRDYLLVEFADFIGLDEQSVREIRQEWRVRVLARKREYLAIPFWGGLLTM